MFKLLDRDGSEYLHLECGHEEMNSVPSFFDNDDDDARDRCFVVVIQ